MIKIFDSKTEISQHVAKELVDIASESIEENGKFVLALTGGSSPIELYKLLTKAEIDWQKVYIFWGDERWVPLDNELSNAKMAHETLLDHIDIPKSQVFPMYSSDLTPVEFASTYESELEKVLGKEGRFDLILLGMGDDGHTASLFPHTEVLKERDKWVVAYYLEPQKMHRITLTINLINQAKNLFVITFGDKKAHALYEVLEGQPNSEEYPSQLLSPTSGKLTFFVDQDAAEKLPKS